MYQFPHANKCFTKAGLAAGTTTTLTTANAQEFSIMGKSYKKTATSNEATPTVDSLTGLPFTPIPAGKGSVFTVWRNASGALRIGQGQVVDLSPLGQFVNAPWFCPQENVYAPIGDILVLCGTGAATWTFGSSNLAGPPTATTIIFVDCAGGMPSRPQVS